MLTVFSYFIVKLRDSGPGQFILTFAAGYNLLEEIPDNVTTQVGYALENESLALGNRTNVSPELVNSINTTYRIVNTGIEIQ